MNYLIARTKKVKEENNRIKQGGYFKVLSNQELFQLPDDLDNPKVYNSDYKLEDDEWFHIPDFSIKPYCIDFLMKPFISIDYIQISNLGLQNIRFLCSYQSGGYYFQTITSSNIIKRKWLKLSDTPSLEKDSPILVINDFPDAIYKKDNDTLYFKRLSSITSIFKGIDELYKEATQQETEKFLKSNFIKLESDYDANKVKTTNRKRIAMAMATIEQYSSKEKTTIYSYIKEYCQDLAFDESESNFTIAGEEDLKKLLYGIEQRYYTTKLGDEKRLANSITIIS
ncbi:MAG: hypothetical protein ABIJ97_00085 [Bacteroidota bacterium]